MVKNMYSPHMKLSKLVFKRLIYLGLLFLPHTQGYISLCIFEMYINRKVSQEE